MMGTVDHKCSYIFNVVGIYEQSVVPLGNPPGWGHVAGSSWILVCLENIRELCLPRGCVFVAYFTG